MPQRTLDLIYRVLKEGKGDEEAAKGLQKLAGAAKAFAASAAVAAVAKTAVELGKLGVASQAASQRFEAFAGSGQQAEKFLSAFNKGTQGTVDRVQAMTSASKLLQMGLVETGSEMTQIAAMATKLGDQTQGAGDRINDFALMLANTSIPRLDNFGISSGRVRERMKELQATGQALNREEAFKLAVMEEGAKALERLGDTTQTTAHQLDVSKAAWQDMKTAAGEMIANLLGTGIAMGKAAEGMRNVAAAARELAEAERASIERQREAKLEWDAIYERATRAERAEMRAVRSHEERAEVLDRVSGNIERRVRIEGALNDAIDESAWAYDEASENLRDYNKQMRQAEGTVADSITAYEDYRYALENTEHVLAGVETATEKMARAEEEAMRVTQEHEAYLFQASISFTDFYRRRRDTAADYNQQLADAEERHRDRLTQLTQEGNAEMIAEENARYEEEMAMLAASREEQEAEQRRSLGRMVLQHFNAWAEMTGLTADEMLKMQTDIAQKYGLIDSTAAQHLRSMQSNWSRTLSVMRGDANSFFSSFMAQFNALPKEAVIRIRQELSGRPIDIPGGGGGGGGTPPADGGGGGAITPPSGPTEPPSIPQPPKTSPRIGGEIQAAALAMTLGGMDILPGFPAPGAGSIQPGPDGFPAPIDSGPIQPGIGGYLPPGAWTLPGGTITPGTQPGGTLPSYIQPGPGQFLPPGETPTGPNLIGSLPGGTPGENPGVWRGDGTPTPRTGGGGGQYAGCNITIYVYTNDAMDIVRELENYMRLRGASSSSMVGH